MLKRLREAEERMRKQQQVAYGLTLTPWLTSRYLDERALDRDQMQALAVVSGIGLLAVLASVALPAVAGLELTQLMALGGLAAREAAPRIILPSAALLQLSRSVQGTMQTATQWMGALGRQIVLP